MSKEVWLNINYHVTKDTYEYESNIQEDKIEDYVINFLRAQMGEGADNREHTVRDVYHIKLALDISFDTFGVWSDCGNYGLRDGILLSFVEFIRSK